LAMVAQQVPLPPLVVARGTWLSVAIVVLPDLLVGAR
jgi:hypothetical protein